MSAKKPAAQKAQAVKGAKAGGRGTRAGNQLSEASRVNLGRLGDFVGFRMRRVQEQLSRDFRQATSDMGLRSGLFSSLAIISANPGISQNELAGAVGLDKSAAVSIIDDMEALGWAQRERSQADRRRHALYVTPQGQASLDQLFETLEQTENAVHVQLSPAELALLGELLDRMFFTYLGKAR